MSKIIITESDVTHFKNIVTLAIKQDAHNRRNISLILNFETEFLKKLTQ